MWTFIHLIASYLVADLITGIFHWLEDTYTFMPSWILCHNRMHHVKPHDMGNRSVWESTRESLFVFICISPMLYGFKWLHFILFIVSIGNGIHKYAHTHERDVPYIIRTLQWCGIIMTRGHHRLHHQGAHDSHYCAVSNHTNIVLEYINFWRNLEFFIWRLTGINPRHTSDIDVVHKCINVLDEEVE